MDVIRSQSRRCARARFRPFGGGRDRHRSCSTDGVLLRLVVCLLLISGENAVFAQPLEVYTTCAAAVPRDPAHLRVLREELSRALRDVGPSRRFTLDVSLVQLRETTVGGEHEIRVEVRAILSDEHRRVLSTSSASTTARGSANTKRLVHREALAGAANRVAKNVLAHVDSEPRVAGK
jgi:hypothetical protein